MSFSAESMFLAGERITGSELRDEFSKAISTVATILRSSFGPQGLDKMLVDQVNEVTITNDGATILQKLDVKHPAAKQLIILSKRQDDDVGDGTTSVVLLGAELYRRATELIAQDVHPTTIINAYVRAAKECRDYISNTLAVSSDELSRERVMAVARTSMSSKIIGAEADHFAAIVADAVRGVKTTVTQDADIDDTGLYVESTDDARAKYPIKNIGVLLANGSSMRESSLIDGMAMGLTRASPQMPRSIAPRAGEDTVGIAVLDMDLRVDRVSSGVEVRVSDVGAAEEIRSREADSIARKIKLLIDAGARAIFVSGAIDDAAQKIMVQHEVMGVRRVGSSDLRRIAEATGAAVITALINDDGVEGVPEGAIGHAGSVEQGAMNNSFIMYIRKPATSKAVTLLLRGPGENMLEEISRSVHDAVCACSRALESRAVVGGGGAVETALAVRLARLAETGLHAANASENVAAGTDLSGKEAVAVREFSRALLALPKILAVNAAKDASELVAQLRAKHEAAQAAGEVCHYGLELVRGGIRDAVEDGVLEPAMGKAKMISSAAEAAQALLRIDTQIVMEKPKQQDQQY